MPALLISVITGLGLLEGIFIKQYNKRHDKGGFIFTALVSLFSMLVFIFTDTGGFNFPPTLWIYGTISGIMYCSASILTFVALGCGSFAMSMLILSYGMVFSIGYGLFFLGEEANVFTYIGLVLILLSLYLTRAKSEESEKKRITLKWVICIGLSVIGSGMFGVLGRMQQIVFDNQCTNEFMIITLGFSALVLFVVGLIKDSKDLGYILKHGGIPASLAGCANGANNLLGLALNLMMPLSINAPIKAGVKVIASFAISIFMFKERFEVRQIVGVVFGAVALVLLNL